MKLSAFPRRRSASSFALAALLLAALRPLAAADAAPRAIKVSVDAGTAAGEIGPDFIGFGYETSAVALPAYFDAANTRLINLYRGLTPTGLVRIGGNISDHTRYEADGQAVVKPQTEITVINRDSLTRLGAFLRATGWQAMWGLNLGTGSAAEAVEEAKAVATAFGDRLHSVEIGNEVDLLPRFHHNYDEYHPAFREYKRAIRAALPAIAFSGPDSANKTDWVLSFADAEAPDVKTLTRHYYRSGAKKPDATLESLLAHDTAWEETLTTLAQKSRAVKIPYRVNETNSFYGGGKKGVSDTFGAALWCLEFMHVLAAHGCSGVNIETDINQFAWTSHYSPIVRDEAGACRATAVYYGMLAFALPGPGSLVPVTVDEKGNAFSAYASRDAQGGLWVTLLNKDRERDARVTLDVSRELSSGESFALSAASLEATENVTLGGREVSARGEWPRPAGARVTVTGRRAELTLPHASATVLHLDPRR